VMTRDVGATTIAAVADADCPGLLLSLTVAVKVEAPLACAVPETIPDGVRIKPAGSEPEVTCHV
jgi:hypothetical protein